MTKRMRGALTVGAALAGMLPAFGLSAQDLSWVFAGEAAGDDVYVLFGQPTVVLGPEVGWQPLVQVGAHWVDNDGDDTWGVTPSVGLRWGDSAGFIGGTVGWAFVDEDADAGFDVIRGNESGLATGLHVEYLGTGLWVAQGIATYNWGADFLWSRARLARRVATTGSGGSVLLGAQLQWEAQADDDDDVDDNEYQGTFVGPVLQFNTASGVGVVVSAGYKHTDPDLFFRDNDSWFVQGELTLP